MHTDASVSKGYNVTTVRVSVKRGVGDGSIFFFKEGCFRVRVRAGLLVRVSVSPNPNTKRAFFTPDTSFHRHPYGTLLKLYLHFSHAGRYLKQLVAHKVVKKGFNFNIFI